MSRHAAVAIGLSMALAAGAARASLTPSEEVVVRQYVAGAQSQNAARVRAVVARPDLSGDESAAAMEHALAPTPVTEARVAFLRELVFGAGSRASRSVLAAAVVRGLLARADAIFDRNPSLESPCSRRPDCVGSVGPSDAASELFRIYAFLGGDIADAGSSAAGRAHDVRAGIDEATYETCAKALAAHLKHRSSTLLPGAALSPIASRIRAQAMLAAFDMGADSPTRVLDGADRIGLDATARRLLIERNVLLLDSGRDVSVRAAAADLARRLPAGALAGIEAIYFGDARPGLRARGEVVAVGAGLDAAARTPGFPEDEVAPSPVPRALGDLTEHLALAVATRALASHGELRLAVQRDVQAAGGDAKRLLGGGAPSSPEAAVASAMAMLLVDAPRTIDLAMARFLAGRPESVALVSDALGVLAAAAGPSGVQSIVLGQGEHDGSIAARPLAGVTLAPNGTVTGFTLAGAHWQIVRDAAGVPTGVHRDGQPLAFAMLSDARIPVSGGASWTGGGLQLRALDGSPLVGVVGSAAGGTTQAPNVVHGPRIRMLGQGDLDVAAIAAPSDDVAFDADVQATGPFAVLLRARGGKDGVGIGLRVVPGDARSPARIAIVNVDASGAEHELAQSSALTSVDHVHVAVHGTTIRAVCTHRGRPPQSASLEAPVPAHQAHGDVALLVKKGSSLELGAVALRRN